MKILDWIFRSAPRDDDPVPNFTTARAPVLPNESDEQEPDTADSATARRFILEPFFVMMEYTDANGTLSRRSITTRYIDDIKGQCYLRAVCHERKALRSFRLDRIGCVISQDGEIEEAEPFFAEIIENAESEMIEAKPASTKAPAQRKKTDSVSSYTAFRRAIAPALVILVATARSDDRLHADELDEILIYCDDEALDLETERVIHAIPDSAAMDKLERTIRRLRPTRNDVETAFREIANWSAPRMKRLVAAMPAVAAADDGEVDEIEAKLIDHIRQAGADRFGLGWDE